MGYRNGAARSRAAHAAVNGPAWSVQPSISGTKAVGSTLTCSPGTVSKAPALSYQWLRNVAGVVSPIAGATAATRLLAAPDQGAKLSCKVTAVKNGITVDATSAETTAIA